jgi:hypothetical protein
MNAEDMVNHPPHYTQGDIECIDAIKAATKGLNGFEGYCTGNAIKYLWRWKYKSGVEDLKKADWYIRKLISGHLNDNSRSQSQAQGGCSSQRDGCVQLLSSNVWLRTVWHTRHRWVLSRGVFFAIECKAGDNKTTALQELELQKIRDAGGIALVINEENIEHVQAAIRDHTGH